jgi:hypothetical protein
MKFLFGLSLGCVLVMCALVAIRICLVIDDAIKRRKK